MLVYKDVRQEQKSFVKWSLHSTYFFNKLRHSWFVRFFMSFTYQKEENFFAKICMSKINAFSILSLKTPGGKLVKMRSYQRCGIALINVHLSHCPATVSSDNVVYPGSSSILASTVFLELVLDFIESLLTAVSSYRPFDWRHLAMNEFFVQRYTEWHEITIDF